MLTETLNEPFDPNWVAQEATPADFCFIYTDDDKLLLREGDGQQLQPPSQRELTEQGIAAADLVCFGGLAGRPCFAGRIAGEQAHSKDQAAPLGYRFNSLYSVLVHRDESSFAIAGRALQILRWKENHHYCGRCGEPQRQHPTERSMQCPACRLTSYPRLSPCVIFLITRGKEMLLARSTNFPDGMFSALAGFVEAGEGVEQAIVREAQEEVNLKVRNPSFFASQPWPFPHQLMLGFYVEFDRGEVQANPDEIAEANWYHYERLPPKIPGNYALSGKLIENFCARLAESS